MTPDISVLMPTYNRAHYIGDAVRCIRKQTHQNWELIIVNDGSTDKTRKIIDNFAEQDSRIRVAHQEHLGTAHTRNQAVELARADWVVGHDDDDLCHPQMLALYFSATKQYPAYDMLSAQMTRFTSRLSAPNPQQKRDTFFNTSLLSRAGFERFGRYRPFFRASEDLDCFSRWKQQKMKRHILPQTAYYYRVHSRFDRSVSHKEDSVLYQMITAYAQARRREGSSDPIAETSTLESVCAQLASAPFANRHRFLQKHLFKDYPYHKRFRFQLLSQAKRHLTLLGYTPAQRKEALQEVRDTFHEKREAKRQKPPHKKPERKLATLMQENIL